MTTTNSFTMTFANRMQGKRSQLCRVGLLLLLCLYAGGALRAQTASGLDVQTDILPFGSYQGSEIDNVNLSNGKLRVTIPLISYPQRGGKLRIQYALIYENTGMFVPGCLPTVFSNGGCAIVFPFQGGFGTADLGSASGNVSCGTQVEQDAQGNQFFTYPCSAAASDADASHVMVPISSTSFMAADGSGYRVDMLPGSDVTQSRHMAGTLITPEGVRYPNQFADSVTPIRVVREDSNGNQILSGPSGLIDTVGRIIPGVPLSPVGLTGVPSDSGNTDSSGCTGPLPVAAASLWTPPGIDGGSYPIKFCYVNVAEINPGGDQNFESCGPAPAGCQQFDVAFPPLPTVAAQLQSVVLPNGTAWTFEYATDGTGNLSKITFPTGGTISYTWTRMDLDGPPQVNSLPVYTKIQPMGIAQRVVDPNDGSSPAGVWNYNYLRGNIGVGGLITGNFVTTVTDANQNDAVHTFGQSDVQGNIYETLTQYYQGPASAGHLLKSIKTDYKSFPVQSQNVFHDTVLPVGWTTTLDNGLQRRQEQDWDSGFLSASALYVQDLQNNIEVSPCGTACSGRAPYGQIIATREFDYGATGPGGILESTSINHLAFSNPSYLNNNLLTLVASRTLRDASGNLISSITDHYDETPLVASGISINHDVTPPAGAVRGNLTSETELITEPANSCNNNLPANSQATAKLSYFDTGMVAQNLDALQHPTNFSYSAEFGGAFPTQACNALNQCVSTTYDINTGQKTSVTDPNGQTVSIQYDIMGRATSVTLPAQSLGGAAVQGSTSFSYDDTPSTASVTQVEQMDATTSVTQTTFFDGFGRKSGGKISDPEGDVFTKTVFDPMGRISTVTNPFRSTSDPTYGVIRNDYDALGRIVQVTYPDNSTMLTTFTGRAVQVQDRGNGTTRVTRISQSDALDHLVSVCEITAAKQINQATPSACGQDIAGTGFLTSYQYDLLGNMTGVQQGGITRSFAYDSASRLLKATNPESGTTCYHYDAKGNLLSRVRPAPNQSDPNVTVTTTYGYDSLNRQISTSYSDSTTASISKHYDTASELGVPLNNTIGRLSAVYVTSPSGQLLSGEVYSYDPQGRIVDNSQCTPQNCSRNTAFPLQYSYDLMGHALSATNGEGVTFSYSYDSGNHLVAMTSSLSDASHPGSLMQGITYTPFRDFSSLTLGEAITENIGYDALGRILSYNSALPTSLASLLPASGQHSVDPVLTGVQPLSRRESLKAPGQPVDGILLGADGKRKKSDRAMMVVRFNTLDSVHPSASVQVPYHGQNVLRTARALAKTMNRNRLLQVRARAKRRGDSALVTISDRFTGKRANYTLSVAIVGMAMAPIHAELVGGPPPEIKAAVSLPPPAPNGN